MDDKNIKIDNIKVILVHLMKPTIVKCNFSSIIIAHYSIIIVTFQTQIFEFKNVIGQRLKYLTKNQKIVIF